MKKKQVAIYNGPGAYSYNVEKNLKFLKISFDKIGKKEIKEKLREYQILIMPGGTPAKYVSSLGKSNFYKAIKEFVFQGGKYIGICAGAYFAPKECIELKRGRRVKLKGLDIINTRCVREHTRRRPGKLRKIIFKTHLIAKGYSQELDVWYHNGPAIVPRKGIKVVALYENNLAAIVSSKYGKGKVILFGTHPEGCRKKDLHPTPKELGTLNLLKNAIDY